MQGAELLTTLANAGPENLRAMPIGEGSQSCNVEREGSEVLRDSLDVLAHLRQVLILDIAEKQQG
ncbi:MAG: hypothetical protein KatS3mg015_2953 [Fimbriimonadales bacterium]|jgi:hypothetical protein|nr:MAG: hypothetical protein KatS3mg015_2953 [Fimbriimonadales bacterium]